MSWNPFSYKYAHIRKAVWAFALPGVALGLNIAREVVLGNHKFDMHDVYLVIIAMVTAGVGAFAPKNDSPPEGA